MGRSEGLEERRWVDTGTDGDGPRGRQRQDREAAVSWTEDASVSTGTGGSDQQGSSNDKTAKGIKLDDKQNLEDDLGRVQCAWGKKGNCRDEWLPDFVSMKLGNPCIEYLTSGKPPTDGNNTFFPFEIL